MILVREAIWGALETHLLVQGWDNIHKTSYDDLTNICKIGGILNKKAYLQRPYQSNIRHLFITNDRKKF